MKELGVGLVYWSALAPLFESGDAAVLELEPQTLWTKAATSSGRFAYQLNEALFESIAGFPQPKLLHGIGQPLAEPLTTHSSTLSCSDAWRTGWKPAWVSEHLSFNRVLHDGTITECGFLLPPAQTPASARVAATNVRRYASAIGRPVAFETGVNYSDRDPSI